jgi:hypothetical protein
MSRSVLVVAAQHFKTEKEQDNKKCRFGCGNEPKLGCAIDVSLQCHHGSVIQRERVSVTLSTGQNSRWLFAVGFMYAAQSGYSPDDRGLTGLNRENDSRPREPNVVSRELINSIQPEKVQMHDIGGLDACCCVGPGVSQNHTRFRQNKGILCWSSDSDRGSHYVNVASADTIGS